MALHLNMKIIQINEIDEIVCLFRSGENNETFKDSNLMALPSAVNEPQQETALHQELHPR